LIIYCSIGFFGGLALSGRKSDGGFLIYNYFDVVIKFILDYKRGRGGDREEKYNKIKLILNSLM